MKPSPSTTRVSLRPRRAAVRPFHRRLCGLIAVSLCLGAASAARAQAPGVEDPGFTVSKYDNARVIAAQPDGKIFVGGYGSIVRLNADGTPDASFSAPGDVASLSAVQPDGKLLVSYDTSVIRLNADGSPDTGFHSPAGPLSISVAAGQSDSRVLIAGPQAFSGPNPFSLQVIRFNADGSLDTSFQNGTADVHGIPMGWENSQTGERFIEFLKDAVYQSSVSLPAIDTGGPATDP